MNNIDLLKNIINSNHEFRPKIDDNHWIKLDDTNVYTINSSKHYDISDKLIKIMNKFSKIYKSIKDVSVDDIIDKVNDNIAIIYLMENNKTDEKYIGYTKNPLYTFIKLNIHKYNVDHDNIFDNFKDVNLNDFSFEIIEYVKYEKRIDIINRRRNYHDEYINNKIGGTYINNNEIAKQLDKIYPKRMEILFEILGTNITKFKSFVGYIFKLENKLNNKIFISGYHKKLLKHELIDILSKNDELNDLIKDIKKYGRRNFELEMIDKYDAKTTFDFLVRIDFFKLKYDSITKGYNKGFSLEESEELFSQRLLTKKKKVMSRNIFLKIQKYLFEKNFKDDNNYDDMYGFVYQIQHKKNKMRYISYAYMDKLKNIIIGMYNGALKGNVKHSKILKVLEEEPYDAFTYKILKKKTMTDTKVSIEDVAESLIVEHDTINKGYNIDKNKFKKNIIRSNMGKKNKKNN